MSPLPRSLVPMFEEFMVIREQTFIRVQNQKAKVGYNVCVVESENGLEVMLMIDRGVE